MKNRRIKIKCSKCKVPCEIKLDSQALRLCPDCKKNYFLDYNKKYAKKKREAKKREDPPKACCLGCREEFTVLTPRTQRHQCQIELRFYRNNFKRLQRGQEPIYEFGENDRKNFTCKECGKEFWAYKSVRIHLCATCRESQLLRQQNGKPVKILFENPVTGCRLVAAKSNVERCGDVERYLKCSAHLLCLNVLGETHVESWRTI